jgi:hypothetical protein
MVYTFEGVDYRQCQVTRIKSSWNNHHAKYEFAFVFGVSYCNGIAYCVMAKRLVLTAVFNNL